LPPLALTALKLLVRDALRLAPIAEAEPVKPETPDASGVMAAKSVLAAILHKDPTKDIAVTLLV
jgi:hypothetical protein